MSPRAYSDRDPNGERYLGYWLDPALDFDYHREKAIEKADVSLQALRSLAGSTWGASLSAMRSVTGEQGNGTI
jgi:hypothetical protein